MTAPGSRFTGPHEDHRIATMGVMFGQLREATSLREEGTGMSAIETVAAIRTDDQPCCIEILVAPFGRRRTLGEDTSSGITLFPDGHGLISLDLPAAQELRARLDVAIQALQDGDSGGDRSPGAMAR
jgi:hypothetical protein